MASVAGRKRFYPGPAANRSLSSATWVVNAVPVQLPNVQRVATIAATLLRNFRYIPE
jgi:hypothetical protein